MSHLDRFMRFVHTEPNSGCWLWGSTITKLGYGRFWLGRSIAAHRASWALHRGQIPLGICVLHHCDVPACVNPAHLFLGTIADNNADKTAKGRARGAPSGGANFNARLDEAAVLHLRESVTSGSETQSEAARRLGISVSAVSQIVLGRHWPTVGGPRVDLGTRGRTASFAKLTPRDVIEIRRRSAAGDSRTDLAAAFGVARRTISDLIDGASWKHVQQQEVSHG